MQESRQGRKGRDGGRTGLLSVGLGGVRTEEAEDRVDWNRAF